MTTLTELEIKALNNAYANKDADRVPDEYKNLQFVLDYATASPEKLNAIIAQWNEYYRQVAESMKGWPPKPSRSIPEPTQPDPTQVSRQASMLKQRAQYLIRRAK